MPVPRLNSRSTSMRMAGFTSVSSSSDARRSGHGFPECGLVVDPVPVGPGPPDEEPSLFQCRGGAVDGCGLHVGFAQREPQFREVGDFVDHPSGRFEEHGGTDPLVNVPERPLGVGVQRSGPGRLPGPGQRLWRW